MLSELIFKTKKKFQFNIRQPLVTIATSRVDACLEQHISAVFVQKASQNSKFFWYFHEECSKWSMLRKFRLDIPLDGILVTIFVSHSFRASTNYTITMAPRMASINLVFRNLSEKVTLLDFQQGAQGFWFLNRDSQSKICNYEPA